MISKLWLGLGAICLLMVSGDAGYARQAPKDKKSQPKLSAKQIVMQKKLVQAQKLLEGLAMGDFDKITASANELAELRKDAAWMVSKSRDYEVFSVEFSRQIEAAKRAAKNKNVDAAALAYVDMTLTCVKCHKYVREEGIARLPNSGASSLGQ